MAQAEVKTDDGKTIHVQKPYSKEDLGHGTHSQQGGKKEKFLNIPKRRFEQSN